MLWLVLNKITNDYLWTFYLSNHWLTCLASFKHMVGIIMSMCEIISKDVCYAMNCHDTSIE